MITIDESLPELDLVFEKLIKSMVRNNVIEVSMESKDNIFKNITRENFKKLYKKVCEKFNKYNDKLRIVIYEAPRKLECEN